MTGGRILPAGVPDVTCAKLTGRCATVQQVSEATGMTSTKAKETGDNVQQQAGSAVGSRDTRAGQQVRTCSMSCSLSLKRDCSKCQGSAGVHGACVSLLSEAVFSLVLSAACSHQSTAC